MTLTRRQGTGGYGAGLTRFLAAHHERVIALDRPKRLPAVMAPSLIRLGCHTVVLTRLGTDPATRADATRRRAQGKSNREIKIAA